MRIRHSLFEAYTHIEGKIILAMPLLPTAQGDSLFVFLMECSKCEWYDPMTFVSRDGSNHKIVKRDMERPKPYCYYSGKATSGVC